MISLPVFLLVEDDGGSDQELIGADYSLTPRSFGDRSFGDGVGTRFETSSRTIACACEMFEDL